MGNDLSVLVPKLFAQGLIVLRQACVMPRLVNSSYSSDAANRGDVITIPISSAKAVTDVTPGHEPVQPPDSTPTTAQIPLNQWKKSGFHLTDKQRGEIVDGHQSREVAETIKALANNINAYIFSKYKKVYGFAGTPGSTPFAADIGGARDVRKVLNKAAVPMQDRRIVLDPDAEANASALAVFLQADQRGDQGGVLQGQIGHKLGMDWFLDQQIPTHTSTPLTAGAATVNGAHAAGAKTVSVAKATNASPLVAGDIITFAGDTQTYTVTENVTLAVGNTNVKIEPGLAVAKAGAEGMTLKGSHVVNLGFHRDAFGFASRPLQSQAANSETIMSVPDPISGIVLRLEVTRQNKQDYYEFDVLYGAECIRPELAARLAG